MEGVAPARVVAFEVIRRAFEDGAWVDRALPAIAERHGLDGRDRAHAQRLAYGAVQRQGTSDAFIKRLSKRPPDHLDAPVLAALRLGLYEVLFGAGAEHAAVGEAVELVKAATKGPRGKGASGLVNAVLRRAVRERAELLASLSDESPKQAAAAHSVPVWLARMWWSELGAESARSLLASVNAPAETALRANSLKADPAQIATELAELGEPLRREQDGLLWPAGAFVADGRLGPNMRDRLRDGRLFAQARAAQAAVELLGAGPGDRVLDACAGPGIKTTAIAAGRPAAIVAIERDPGRASQTQETVERAGASGVEVRIADAASAELGHGYDRILVDPPCSDLGTLASRPDARWRKSPDAITELVAAQAAIAANAARALAPGGTLIYSTCTVSRAENEEVMAGLLAADPDLRADALGAEHPRLASPHDGRFLQTRPDRDGTDGFFIARLTRERA